MPPPRSLVGLMGSAALEGSRTGWSHAEASSIEELMVLEAIRLSSLEAAAPAEPPAGAQGEAAAEAPGGAEAAAAALAPRPDSLAAAAAAGAAGSSIRSGGLAVAAS
jgi:hypothetical protein